MLAKADANELMRRLSKRNRRRLAVRCLAMGIGIAEIGLVCWGLRNAGLDGIIIIALGVLPAGVYGFLFGLLAILVVPGALERKPVGPATKAVFLGTSLLMSVATLATGFFPFPMAGVSLCIVTLWVMFRMPNEPIDWSPKQCIACAYDLRASGPLQCPECGLSAEDIQKSTTDGTFNRVPPVATAWVSFALAVWMAVAAWVALTMDPIL